MRVTNNFNTYSITNKNNRKLPQATTDVCGNFDKYISKMYKLATKTKANILNLAQDSQDENIRNYCKTNLLLINRFLLKNANKSYYEIRKQEFPKQLEKKANEIITKLGYITKKELDLELKLFNILKTEILNKYNNDNKHATYCKNIEICLIDTIKLATSKM